MKTRLAPKRTNQGNILLVCMCIAIVIGISLAALMMWSQDQYASVARSATWNGSMAVTESGVEDAMSLINKFGGSTTNVTTWSSFAAADGWDVSGIVYHMKRYVGASSNYYDVWVTNSSVPVIRSVGVDKWNYQSAALLKRAVVIQTTLDAGNAYPYAILAKKGLSFSGGMIVDSFDSTDTNYSTNGHYDPSKRKDGGNVGTVESNVLAAVTESGGADVYGHVYTGPSDGVKVSGGGAIGSLSFINGGSTGIQSGWTNNNLNISVPDAPTPPTAAYLPLPTMVGGKYILNAGGPGDTAYYYVPNNFSLSGANSIIITNGTVVLDAQGSVSMSGSSSLAIAANANLVFYLNGSTTLSGGGVVNSAGYPTNCTLYGSANCTSISYSGGSDFIGTIWAPEATFTLSGGASLIGQLVANSGTLSGNAHMSYDESLSKRTVGAPTFYRAYSWQEVPP